MSTTATKETTRATACPSWCAAHLGGTPGDTTHLREVRVGNGAAWVEWWDGIEDGAPIITLPPALEQIRASAARDLAAAVVAAADLIEGAR